MAQLNCSVGGWWPIKPPDARLDYSIDISADLADVADTVATVTLDFKPSGTGEVTLTSLSFANGIATVFVAGGTAGRLYIYRFLVATANNRILEYFVKQRIESAFSATPWPIPASVDYSLPALVWTAPAT